MARQRTAATAADHWAALTWDDLEQWAGSRSVSRGRSYQRGGRVRDLAVGDDGTLLATVQGTQRYAVRVALAGKRPQSRCTCPVGANGCKHAVATVAAYLQALADGTPVARANPEDRRAAELAGERFEDPFEDHEDDDDLDDEYRGEATAVTRGRRKSSKPKARSRAEWDELIEADIRQKGKEELAELVVSLVQRFPELRDEFRERIALQSGDVNRLVAEARRELHRATAEPGWSRHWSGEGYTPDFMRFQHRLERLLEMGHADPVVALGREFIERARNQVGQSDDEGETAQAVAGVLPVIFQAVAASALPPAQKILFAIDAVLEDDYDVIDGSASALLERKWTRADWSEVADRLAARLRQDKHEGQDRFSRNCDRDRISSWLAEALARAGRAEEEQALLETEARTTKSYWRLVQYLLERGRTEEAERWAREGIAATIKDLPGIATQLAAQLCELARRRKHWDVVAAHAGLEFLGHPDERTFEDLLKAAAKAGCEDAARQAALRFLETGTRPAKVVTKNGRRELRADPSWPLPWPDYFADLLRDENPYRPAGEPYYDVLLDMAIAAKKPDEVLHWYDKLRAKKAGRDHFGWYARDHADRVAAAVAAAHPERALAIYRDGLDQNLGPASQHSYENAGAYLRKLRPVYQKLDRGEEWTRLVAEIREKNRNRPRFQEVLDRVEGKSIVAMQRKRGR